MKHEDIAIIISTVSAAITTGGLIWQITLYRLSGARLHVTLIPCILDSAGTIFRGPAKGWTGSGPQFLAQLGKWNIELAEVSVTNIGRTPVSVHNIALDFGRVHPCGRHTIQGTPLEFHGSSSENKHRLEPGDAVSVLFDLSQVVKSVRRSRSGKVVIRGTAQPVGRTPRRSSWSRRWKLGSDVDVEAMLRPKETITPELRAYRALWRGLQYNQNLKEYIQLTWFAVLPKLKSGVTPDEVADALSGVLDSPYQMLSFDVVEAYNSGKQPAEDSPLET